MTTQRLRQSIVTLTLWLIALVMQPTALATEGKLVYDKVHSPALEGNLLGDSATRSVTVYLPPGYDENTDMRYPVLYLLHGYTGTNRLWTGSGYFGSFNIQTLANSLIEQGRMKPMLIVMPDAWNKLLGSWYVSSPVSGNYEDYIVQDLRAYIDSKYRTLPNRESRAVSGHSMGAFGAMVYAMKYPDVFGAVASHSGIWVWDEKNWAIPYLNLPATAKSPPKSMAQLQRSSFKVKMTYSLAVLVSPNLDNPPLFVDLPYTSTGKLIPEIWQRWMEYEIFNLLDKYDSSLATMRGIFFEIGEGETRDLPAVKQFHEELTKLGIAHEWKINSGGHIDGIEERLTQSLTYLSEVLSFESVTSVQPRDKLTVTWGEVKRGR